MVIGLDQHLFSENGIVRVDELSPKFSKSVSFDEPLNGLAITGGLRERSSVLRVSFAPEERKPFLQVMTREGHSLVASPDTVALTWSQGSQAIKWARLEEIKPGDRLFARYGQQMEAKAFTLSGGSLRSGFGFDFTEPVYFLLGAISSAVNRSGQWSLMISSPIQISRPHQIAQEIGLPQFFHTPLKFSRFTGVYKIDGGAAQELVCWSKSNAFMRILRRSPLGLQKAWLAGLIVTAARWTCDSLEIELDLESCVSTLTLLLQNLGIRTVVFRTLDVYGQHRLKVSFRSEEDFQLMFKTVLGDQKLPCPWRERKLSTFFDPVVLDGKESQELREIVARRDIDVQTVHDVVGLTVSGAGLDCPVGSDGAVNGFVVQL